MRFEVKSGGIAAIVLAMTLLSGSVFVLGLLAGYDVGRQAELDTAQLATSFPLQAEPSSSAQANPSPGASGNPAVQSAALTTPAAASTPLVSTPQHGSTNLVNAKPKHSQTNAIAGRQRLGATSALSAGGASSKTASAAAAEEVGSAEDESADAGDESAGAPSPDLPVKAKAAAFPAAHHKPYNIEIQAAMDISGADQMMARLHKLGYPSHLVPTEIAGQRWYKVEVGPYATTAEASSAEANLRQRYNAAYGAAHANPTSQESASDNPEE